MLFFLGSLSSRAGASISVDTHHETNNACSNATNVSHAILSQFHEALDLQGSSQDTLGRPSLSVVECTCWGPLLADSSCTWQDLQGLKFKHQDLAIAN